MNEPQRLKRAVIKEELVELTGDHIKALILNQFLYWIERRRDFDRFIEEELERDPSAHMELTHGWIYKTGEDLSDELMLGVASQTVRRHIGPLVEAGWLEERDNPEHKWDRTKQYRPNVSKIAHDLDELGYSLDGFANLQKPGLHVQNGDSNERIAQSNRRNEPAIPETTTETTTEKGDARTREDGAGAGVQNETAPPSSDNGNNDSTHYTRTREIPPGMGGPRKPSKREVMYAQMNAELPIDKRKLLVDELARYMGVTAMIEADEDEGLLRQLHQGAIAIYRMGESVRDKPVTVKDLRDWWQAWREDWRSNGGASLKQVKHFVSERLETSRQTEQVQYVLVEEDM